MPMLHKACGLAKSKTLLLAKTKNTPLKQSEVSRAVGIYNHYRRG
ncbi:MAG: hypothetical protein HLUCCO06_14805 [Halomonas sp. HL-93]|nr:MAG: hypothetical protein HLUCCO06_14805 [Halomonas sp. HL-93]